MLLLAGRAFTTDLESWSQLLAGALLAGALCVTIAASGRLAIVVALVLATDGYVLINSTLGLETPLAMLFVAVIFVMARREHSLVWPLAVLATLARPELGVFVLALPLVSKRRDFAFAIVALLAITALRWAIFDDVLPNTFWAKRGGSFAHARLGALYCWELARDFPLVLAAPLALRRDSTRSDGEQRAIRYLLVASALAFLFFLRTGGDTFLYSRLAMPFIPVLTALGIVGLWSLAQTRIARALVLTLIVLAGARGAYEHWVPPQHGFDNVGRWTLVGKWLASHRPRATIATVPIGAIGYFSRARVIDLVGLTERTIAHHETNLPSLPRSWIAHERSDPQYVLQQHPDLIVFTKWQGRPWTLDEAKAGFWAERELLDAIRNAHAPYRIVDAQVWPGVYWLMFERVPTE